MNYTQVVVVVSPDDEEERGEGREGKGRAEWLIDQVIEFMTLCISRPQPEMEDVAGGSGRCRGEGIVA